MTLRIGMLRVDYQASSMILEAFHLIPTYNQMTCAYAVMSRCFVADMSLLWYNMPFSARMRFFAKCVEGIVQAKKSREQ